MAPPNPISLAPLTISLPCVSNEKSAAFSSDSGMCLERALWKRYSICLSLSFSNTQRAQRPILNSCDSIPLHFLS